MYQPFKHMFWLYLNRDYGWLVTVFFDVLVLLALVPVLVRSRRRELGLLCLIVSRGLSILVALSIPTVERIKFSSPSALGYNLLSYYQSGKFIIAFAVALLGATGVISVVYSCVRRSQSSPANG